MLHRDIDFRSAKVSQISNRLAGTAAEECCEVSTTVILKPDLGRRIFPACISFNCVVEALHENPGKVPGRANQVWNIPGSFGQHRASRWQFI